MKLQHAQTEQAFYYSCHYCQKLYSQSEKLRKKLQRNRVTVEESEGDKAESGGNSAPSGSQTPRGVQEQVPNGTSQASSGA